MNENNLKRMKLPAIIGLLAVWLIVAISAPHASAETTNIASDGSNFTEKYRPVHPPLPVPPVPFFENGETERTIEDYKGKVVVMNFWAKWCAPCLREMPSLDRLQAKMKDLGVEVLALSLDRQGAEAVKPYFKTAIIKNLAVLIDKNRSVARALGVKGLPTTLIIDRDGQEVGRLEGPTEWDSNEVLSMLKTHLTGSAEEAALK